MDGIFNLLIGELSLSPEMLFVARCIALILVVEVLTSLISVIIPLVKLTR